MEVKMNKEIRDYQESMFLGLDFRQCFFSVPAILTAVGIYFGAHSLLGEEVTGWLCVLGAAPFAACGFFKYHGMNAEQLLWAVKTLNQSIRMDRADCRHAKQHVLVVVSG